MTFGTGIEGQHCSREREESGAETCVHPLRSRGDRGVIISVPSSQIGLIWVMISGWLRQKLIMTFECPCCPESPVVYFFFLVAIKAPSGFLQHLELITGSCSVHSIAPEALRLCSSQETVFCCGKRVPAVLLSICMALITQPPSLSLSLHQ